MTDDESNIFQDKIEWNHTYQPQITRNKNTHNKNYNQ